MPSNALLVSPILITFIMMSFVIFAWWWGWVGRQAVNDRIGREGTLWLVPAMLMTGLLISIWVGSQRIEGLRLLRAHQSPVDIDVVELDRRWLFIYHEQGIASLNRLTVPEGVPLHFSLASVAVAKNFFIPGCAGQVHCMSRSNALGEADSDALPKYQQLSVLSSGESADDLTLTVEAASPEGFDRWVAQTRQYGQTLDPTTLAELFTTESPGQPATFSEIDPDLFHVMLTGTLAARLAASSH